MDQIDQSSDRIEELSYKIPEEYLQKCKWFYPIESDKVEDKDKAVIESAIRHAECFYLHNNFVDYYNKNLRERYGR